MIEGFKIREKIAISRDGRGNPWDKRLRFRNATDSQILCCKFYFTNFN
jgi:hypothetical protein